MSGICLLGNFAEKWCSRDAKCANIFMHDVAGRHHVDVMRDEPVRQVRRVPHVGVEE